jgi:hypothetical protein
MIYMSPANSRPTTRSSQRSSNCSIAITRQAIADLPGHRRVPDPIPEELLCQDQAVYVVMVKAACRSRSLAERYQVFNKPGYQLQPRWGDCHSLTANTTLLQCN